ncbi:hypothetical protein [uncultured Clostridium sp.]|uniref:hypothetical protein n=1 Tax=uncultured Clostridium sp. TaxID=59620 RepID=UPI0028EC1184|nr:hypothetical protein [uncultured Clostridium sp.]
MEIIHENYEKIDVFKDFWKVHQGLRKDYYLINSVKDIFDGFATIDSKEKCKENNSKMDKYVENINILNRKYLDIEQNLSDKSEKVNDEVAAALDEECIELNKDFSILYEVIVQSINLSSEMQELITDALVFIKNKRNEFNENLIKVSNIECINYFIMRDRDNIKTKLNRSIDEDKIINYEIVCSNTSKDVVKDFRTLVNKHGNLIVGNNKKIMIKKIDRSYIIERLIAQVQNQYEYTIQIESFISNNNKEKNVNRLNKNLFIINIVAPIIGVISILPIINKIYELYGWEKICLSAVVIFCIIVIFYRSIFNKKY